MTCILSFSKSYISFHVQVLQISYMSSCFMYNVLNLLHVLRYHVQCFRSPTCPPVSCTMFQISYIPTCPPVSCTTVIDLLHVLLFHVQLLQISYMSSCFMYNVLDLLHVLRFHVREGGEPHSFLPCRPQVRYNVQCTYIA